MTLLSRGVRSAAAVCVLLASGCATHVDAGQGPDTSGVTDSQVCGAFSVVNILVHETMEPGRQPGPDVPRKYDLVGLADALNNAAGQGMSADLKDALAKYVYAVASLGAALNHHDPSVPGEVIEPLGRRVSHLCGAPPIDTVPTTESPAKEHLPDDPAAPGR